MSVRILQLLNSHPNIWLVLNLGAWLVVSLDDIITPLTTRDFTQSAKFVSHETKWQKARLIIHGQMFLLPDICLISPIYLQFFCMAKKYQQVLN